MTEAIKQAIPDLRKAVLQNSRLIVRARKARIAGGYRRVIHFGEKYLETIDRFRKISGYSDSSIPEFNKRPVR